MIWNRALDNGGYMLGDDVEVNIAVEAVHQKEAPAATPAPAPKQ